MSEPSCPVHSVEPGYMTREQLDAFNKCSRAGMKAIVRLTLDDVAMLRESAEDDQSAYDNHEKLRELADRIEALLPDD